MEYTTSVFGIHLGPSISIWAGALRISPFVLSSSHLICSFVGSAIFNLLSNVFLRDFQSARLLRCGKSYKLWWINYLRADLKRGNITAEEEETIVKLHTALDNRWCFAALDRAVWWLFLVVFCCFGYSSLVGVFGPAKQGGFEFHGRNFSQTSTATAHPNPSFLCGSLPLSSYMRGLMFVLLNLLLTLLDFAGFRECLMAGFEHEDKGDFATSPKHFR
ncbi:unnamed protein product [Prunus armeniaca]